jgi:hypothetical protein
MTGNFRAAAGPALEKMAARLPRNSNASARTIEDMSDVTRGI